MYKSSRAVNDSGIGIRFQNQNRNQSLVCWNWNHMMLESESKFLGYTGIGIRIGITCSWNQNWNRKPGFRKTLESESALVESELESLVPESFTTLYYSPIFTPRPLIVPNFVTDSLGPGLKVKFIKVTYIKYPGSYSISSPRIKLMSICSL